jgi:hypothetical protein
VQCPTPKKISYASKEAAESGAVLASVKLYPYFCPCGLYHLSIRRSVADTASSEMIEKLQGMPDRMFANLVATEVVGKASPEEAAALRTPEIQRRWQTALGALSTEIEGQLAARKGDSSPLTREWRSTAISRRGFIAARREEIRFLRGKWLDARTIANQSGQSSNGKQRRSAAGEAAMQRLIDAHRDEFRQLIQEELARLNAEGLEAEAAEEANQ